MSAKSHETSKVMICDGNEAAAYVAYRLSEVCAIYPITPSSTMAELADQWSSVEQKNIWGNVPLIAEMQSEGGAAGTVHGALQSGALTSTFTASQGLMLMLPNMYKIAGELTSAVFHVAARSLAAQGLSIFGDHQDIMAARGTGFALLASSSVQEAHDMALIAHSSTLDAHIPFIHFFDGFRTSHEVNKINLLSDQQIAAMINEDAVREHRNRALRPDNPYIRGTAQNPDVYFQARETTNPFYEKVPAIVQAKMDQLGKLTGRSYKTVEYFGDPEAEYLTIAMGSGIETIKETINWLNSNGYRAGAIQIRLYRPLDEVALVAAIPETTRAIAIMDRTKEVGANGDPLYQDILTALVKHRNNFADLPVLSAGRYGLSSKEFTPSMVKAIYDELMKDTPKQHFTIGIIDDVGHTSLDYDETFDIESSDTVRALFFGLGSDGTVGANKNTIKIIGSDPDYFAQAYFVYDSKKSGSMTESHLRFGKQPIDSPYLLQSANFIACHQSSFLNTKDMLQKASEGATFLLNSSVDKDQIWDQLPSSAQQILIDKKMKLYVIDAYKVAQQAGMGKRINTVMQACFFALSDVLPSDIAIERIKQAIEKTYSIKGPDVVKKNWAAVDQSISYLNKVEIPETVTSSIELKQSVPDSAPEFIKDVTAMMMAGKGDRIPVSQLPVDGTYPSATSQWEKRTIAQQIPIWEPDDCIQCGNCTVVCPHAAIRAKFYHRDWLDDAPDGFKHGRIAARGFPDTAYTLQVYPDDCTGCTLCVEACPVDNDGEHAINMKPLAPVLDSERGSLNHFDTIPYNDRSKIDFSNIKGAQFLQPLFEFSGACSGCGETPYLKMVSQLFGDRMMVANATGCSSIYGGNLPTTPWSKTADGRGPAWSNSLFEDNAEFGFGYRLAATKHHQMAIDLLNQMKTELPENIVSELIANEQQMESEIQHQIQLVKSLKESLLAINSEPAKHLHAIADQLIRRSIWIVGGDGWAYDIGYGGLDHVLGSGADVNVLVMDTEVYSNTGGQMSKSTPYGAVAKFATSGKQSAKKDLALQAIAYNNIYVARVAFGADPQQTLLALREAEAYPGPSLIIAYSHCIAHGIQMNEGLKQQQLAVKSGHWPLFRYNPNLRDVGENPFSLDSLRPTIKLQDYRKNEVRYQIMQRKDPEHAKEVTEYAQSVAERKWQLYEELASRSGAPIAPHVEVVD